MKASGLERFDYRWGFQDDALMSVTRLKAPKPRKGFLALFDQPTFDKGKLPPLPEGIESFGVLSVDPAKAFGMIQAMLPTPAAQAKLTEAVDALKNKSRLDLRKDLLARLGPKVAFYVMPGSNPATARAAGEPEKDAAGAAGGSNPLGGLLGGMIPGALRSGWARAGAVQIPRVTMVAQVDDPEAFGKSLETLMIALNRQLKEQASASADAAARRRRRRAGGRRGGSHPEARRQGREAPAEAVRAGRRARVQDDAERGEG